MSDSYQQQPEQAIPWMRPEVERQRMFCGPALSNNPDVAVAKALAAGRAAAQDKEEAPDLQQRRRARLGM